MKSLEELIAIRAAAFDEIRRQQMRIAAIDVAITSDPRYAKLMEEWRGDVETSFPDLRCLGEENPCAMFN